MPNASTRSVLTPLSSLVNHIIVSFSLTLSVLSFLLSLFLFLLVVFPCFVLSTFSCTVPSFVHSCFPITVFGRDTYLLSLSFHLQGDWVIHLHAYRQKVDGHKALM
jgi:hypothetical protein